eukprot:TRINITY_DN117_c0_g1_i2.p1 TRINITY_DN117_c0_g1~~TRINITY_DN117_c0_g1_i2.p1  ORF type:complete len:272 (+),score=49.27 TRINITY_DN117_c0_g1_i2:51-866(+)
MRAARSSQALNLRNFFAWVKSVLIEQCVGKGEAVLDLSAGWNDGLAYFRERAGKLVSVEKNPSDAIEGGALSAKLSLPGFTCTVLEADAMSPSLAQKLPNCAETFDVVTCFSGFDTAFSSEEGTLQFFKNVAEALKQGGMFVGLTMDANIAVKRLRVSDRMSFGNTAYSLTFLGDHSKRFPIGQPCGHQYEWTNADDKRLGTREFLVIWPWLERAAAAAGLRALWQINLHDFFRRYRAPHAGLWERHRILGVPEDEWEIAYLHKVFAFEKL